MEREQRSEGLLWDFIRANCQRMKHELAKRDCGLGQYHRDPRAAAAVILLQLHSQCVKRTHTITHTRATTRRPHTHWHTQCHNWPAKSGWAWNQAKKKKKKKTPLPESENEGPHPLNPPKHQARTSEMLTTNSACACLYACVHVPPSLHVCFNCIHFSYRLEKKKKEKRKSDDLFFFFFIVSAQSLIHTVPQ